MDESRDIDWEFKQNQAHLRGSTVTGFTANGGWRRNHRQRFVNGLDSIEYPVNILEKIRKFVAAINERYSVAPKTCTSPLIITFSRFTINFY